MSELMWIRSHVERLLQGEWDVCRLTVDEDGDWPYRTGTAACWVTVMDTEPTMVRVFAHAATGIRPSLKLLTELNEIQGRALSATILVQGRAVLVSQTISPISLTQPVLAQAMRSVGGVANDIGVLIAGMFSGVTPYPAAAPQPEEAA